MSAGNGDGKKLVERARAAVEAMFARHFDKARAIARKWAFKTMRGDELEDLVSEAYLGLWKACISYRPDRGTAEATWAHYYITGAVTHYLRDHAWIVRLPKWIPPTERWAAISKFLAPEMVDPWTHRFRSPENGEESPDEYGPAELDIGIEEAELVASLPVLDARERLLVAMALEGANRVDLAAADRGALVRLMAKLGDTEARREAAARAAENMRERMMRRRRRGGRGVPCVCCSEPGVDSAIAAGLTYKEAGARFGISAAAICHHRAVHGARKLGAAGVVEAMR